MKSIAIGLSACWLAATAFASKDPTIAPPPQRMERVESASRLAMPIESRLDLRENWFLQSSSKIGVSAEALSSSQFSPDHWYKATVPSTVLAARIANGEFKDLYFGDNLRKLPGLGQPPTADPYAVSWWYRTEFKLPPDFRGRKVWLHFNGINAKGNIWLNGKKLADAHEFAGAHRIFELEATSLLDSEGSNVLAVESFEPTDDDFSINLVDWCPTPPDKNMGLWREVYLTASGPVRVRYPSATTHFPGDPLQRADLTVRTELYNDTSSSIEGTLRGEIGSIIFKKVTLAPREAKPVMFTPDEFPQLQVNHPELWWPNGLGAQTLHQVSVIFETAGSVSDSQSARFGIREITSELYGASPQIGEVYNNNGDFSRKETDKRPLLIRVNRKPVLIRGAGWSPEMLLRKSRERFRAELTYVRDMHLNAIRLEGKLEGDEFFDIADELGILILAGWCCGDRWEHWSSWQPNDYTIATDSLRTQLLRLRHHACLALWMNGSDNLPPANVEEAYRKVLAETGWPNPVVSSSSSSLSSVSGPSGVKMTGPYDYVPPGYWLIDTDHFGGAFGFNTETSPGAAIPVMSSLKKFIPKDHLWPIDAYWNLHTGAGNLNGDLTHFNASMDAMYGPPTGLDDYISKSQCMAYDGERAMFEAYGRNKYQCTGVIQWMLDNGWPSLIWHLYDFYLQPAAGYFGTKKACEPLHIQYSYDNRSVVVVNSSNLDVGELTAEATLYDFNLQRRFSRKVRLASAADSVQSVCDIPADNIDTDVYFVHLILLDKAGDVLSRNFYWLPKKLSTFDWSLEQARQHPYYTAVTRYEDLSMLNRLTKVHLDASASIQRAPGEEDIRVQIRNPSENLAFMVHLSVVDGKTGEEILPVLWEDNYFSLLPGESRAVRAHYNSAIPHARLRLEVNGWNIDAEASPINDGGKGANR